MFPPVVDISTWRDEPMLECSNQFVDGNRCVAADPSARIIGRKPHMRQFVWRVLPYPQATASAADADIRRARCGLTSIRATDSRAFSAARNEKECAAGIAGFAHLLEFGRLGQAESR